MQNYWILATDKPKQALSSAAARVWKITHDWEAVQAGDAVVLWQTQPTAGIYALAQIQQKNDVDGTRSVTLGDIERLPHLLLQSLLKNHPVLQQMAVMQTRPVTLDCSNFPLTAEEWQALQMLLKDSFVVPQTAAEHEAKPDLAAIAEYLQAQGLRYSDHLLRRYHLSLHSRQFVILSGISGTGKTALAETYAQAVNAAYVIVPVAPNWMSNEDLLGYYNPMTQSYQDTESSRFLRCAAQAWADNPDAPRPYHLILDEMNLARVEHYFARLLSLLEVRRRGQAVSLEFAQDDCILLPKNLYVIGTVNQDESTYGFADKVYDRAQYLELHLEREPLVDFLGELPYAQLLLELWDVLQPVAPFGFRVLEDIQAYVEAAKTLNIAWNEAVDEQIVQKLLPKLKGTDAALEAALHGLQVLAKQYALPHTQQKTETLYATFLQQGLI